MNFTKESNAFKEWVQYNNIPSNAVLLWFVLMTFKHSISCQGKFRLSNLVVQQFTGLSKQGLTDARRKLVDFNLLDYEKGNKGKDPSYQMRSLVHTNDQSEYELHDKLHKSTQSSSLSVGKVDSSSTQSTNPLVQTSKSVHRADSFHDKNVSLYRHRQDKKEELEIVHFYESHIGILSPLARERLLTWQEKFRDEVICAAIEIGAEHGAKKVGYIVKILQEWERNGLKTVGDVLAYRQEKLTHSQKTFYSDKKNGQSSHSIFDELRRGG
jgi:DnaD/phage-associated family protein